MKIRALRIDGYGVWKDLRIDAFSEGLNVLYGPNEAGKTTLLQFIRSALYGFENDRRRYFPPVYGGRWGGGLDVDGSQGRYEISRHLDDPDSNDEDVTLIAPDGARQGEHLLKTMLAHVDEPTFNNVFAVELREMQELYALGDTEAAAMLYNLTAGLDRVSLVEVIEELQASRNRLLDAAGKPSQITQLLADREKVRQESDELALLTRRFNQLAADRENVEREVRRLEEEEERISHERRLAEIALTLRESWIKRRELDDRLASFAAHAPPPEGAVERLDLILSRKKKLADRLARMQKKCDSLRAEAKSLRIDDALQTRSSRIEALLEQRTWLLGLKDRIAETSVEFDRQAAELAEEWKSVGLTGNPIAAHPEQLEKLRIPSLKAPGQAVQRRRKERERAELNAAAAKESADSLQAKLAEALRSRNQNDLPTAMDRAGLLVSQYRRRLQIEERIDQLNRHRADLDDQRRDLTDRQMLSGGAIFGFGAAAVFCLALIPAGFTLFSGPSGWFSVCFGVIGCGAVFATKKMHERSLAVRLESCEQQLEMLETQLQQTQEERDQLDQLLPKGGGPIVSRLDAAEQDLAALEELVPLETQLNGAKQEAAAAAMAADQAATELKQAKLRWQDAIKNLGLPADYSYAQAKSLARKRRDLLDAQRILAEKSSERARLQIELQSWRDRLSQIAAEANVEQSADPVEMLNSLAEALSEQRDAIAQRDALRGEYKRLRKRHAKTEMTLSRLRHRRRELLFEAGVRDEDELRRLAEQSEQVEALRRRREDLSQEISSAIADEYSEETVEKLIKSDSPEQLNAKRTSADERLKIAVSQIRAATEKRGQLAAQWQTLVEDRRPAEKRMELASLDRRIFDALRRWQALAVTCRALELIKRSYEQERQPEALREASGYLARLTGGRYVRVWTPLGENSLRVDDDEGREMPVETLSRGTREQLYLSLRMALASSFAKRGASLPLVLDDVLVNFDSERAAAAAEVLRDFAAAGRQTIVFTCHEHIRDIFAAKAPTRQLPYAARGAGAVISFAGGPDAEASVAKPRGSRKKAEIADDDDEDRPIKRKKAAKDKKRASRRPAARIQEIEFDEEEEEPLEDETVDAEAETTDEEDLWNDDEPVEDDFEEAEEDDEVA